MKTLAIVSGGLDSVVMAHLDIFLGAILSFDFGPSVWRELEYAALCATRLEVPWKVMGLGDVKDELVDSPILGTPNRNAIMLSIAFGIAASQGYDKVSIGVNAEDGSNYPDCRPAFLNFFNQVGQLGLKGGPEVNLVTPFIGRSKAEIVSAGSIVEVPFELTWSCYKGGTIHCGSCRACRNRKSAFISAGVKDPTSYQQ